MRVPMASKAKIAMNERRKQLSEKYNAKRLALKAVVVSQTASDEERDLASRQLQRLPRNANPTRIRNRCNLTGRPRAYYRKFGLSRIALRELGLSGEVPGLTKSSW